MMATFPLPLTAQTPPPPQQQEEPILPDSEFEARLPKAGEAAVDPGAPLPSIDEWIDRQMPPAEAAGNLPPTGEPQEQRSLAQPLHPLHRVPVPAQAARHAKPPSTTTSIRLRA